MAEFMLETVSPVTAALVPGRIGPPEGPPGVTLQAWQPEGVASLAVRRGQEAVLPAMLGGLGLVLPTGPGWSEGGGMDAVWAGPGRWLVFGDGDVVAALSQRVGSVASITDQTDARVLLRLSGPRARDVLAKGVGLDLHPRAFGPGDAAGTVVSHVNIQLWQLDDTPSYDLAVPRGFAQSFCEFLLASAAEYGLAVLPPA